MTTQSPSMKFDSLFAKFEAKTRQVQAKILRNKDSVDECQQTLWLRIWQQVQTGETIVNPNAYLCTAARNEALCLRRSQADDETVSLDSLRDDSDGSSSFEPAENPYDQNAIDPRLRQALRAAVDGLPGKIQEAVSRHYFGGQPVAQIAREMKVTQSCVTSYLTRGRSALRLMFTRAEGRAA